MTNYSCNYNNYLKLKNDYIKKFQNFNDNTIILAPYH